MWSGRIFDICLSFCVTWIWTWQKCQLWRVDRQSRTGLIYVVITERVNWLDIFSVTANWNITANMLCSELIDGTVELLDHGSSGYIRITSTQLVLTVTDVDDSGMYICNATNNVGSDTSSAHLSVLGNNITNLLYRFCSLAFSEIFCLWVMDLIN